MIDHTLGRVLSLFDIDSGLSREWAVPRALSRRATRSKKKSPAVLPDHNAMQRNCLNWTNGNDGFRVVPEAGSPLA